MLDFCFYWFKLYYIFYYAFSFELRGDILDFYLYNFNGDSVNTIVKTNDYDELAIICHVFNIPFTEDSEGNIHPLYESHIKHLHIDNFSLNLSRMSESDYNEMFKELTQGVSKLERCFLNLNVVLDGLSDKGVYGYLYID